MSVQAMTWVLDRSSSELAARLVLLAIANHCDADGRNAWPSQSTIAREAHVSTRTVRRCITDLVASGELSVVPHCGRSTGAGRTNYYELSGYINERETRTDCPPARADTRTSAPHTRTSTTPNVDNCVLQTVLEPSLEPSSSSSAAIAQARRLAPVEEETAFLLVDLKLAARKADRSVKPIVNEQRWKARTTVNLLDGAFAADYRSAAGRWPAATPAEIARFLFDGTMPSAPRPVWCSDCLDNHHGACATETGAER